MEQRSVIPNERWEFTLATCTEQSNEPKRTYEQLVRSIGGTLSNAPMPLR